MRLNRDQSTKGAGRFAPTWRTGSASLVLAASFVLLSAMPSARGGITLSTLCSFAGTNGASPNALVQGADGSLYGTTSSGGSGSGTVFRVTPDGALSTLVSFNGTNGADPRGLVQGTNGDFYGTTEYGGANGIGTVFRMTPEGELSTLVSFDGTNGAYPFSGPVLGRDGNFYGTTSEGGNYIGAFNTTLGTVFRMTPDGVFTNLASFDGTNGCDPTSLMQSIDGSFYGTTVYSGTNFQGLGTVFRITPDGNLTTLFWFDSSNGGACLYGLVQGLDGSLWGTTDGLGSTQETVFRLTTNGDMTILFSFDGTNGATPRRLIQGPDFNFYGVTGSGGTGYVRGTSPSGDGTIFKITPTGAMNTLVYFDGTDGLPFTGLLRGSDGCFYGTTMNGGTGGSGTVFRLSVPLAPVIQTISQRNGSITFGWSAVSGQTYQVQYRTDFDQTNWTDIGNAITATNGVATTFDTVGPGPQRFYRVRLVP